MHKGRLNICNISLEYAFRILDFPHVPLVRDRIALRVDVYTPE
jgi:hypothetical protein